MLSLINSDVRWVRLTTLAVSLVAGALIWEIVGWNFNPAIMVPLIYFLARPQSGSKSAGRK